MTYIGAMILKVISIVALSIMFCRNIFKFAKSGDKGCEASLAFLIIIFLYVINK